MGTWSLPTSTTPSNLHPVQQCNLLPRIVCLDFLRVTLIHSSLDEQLLEGRLVLPNLFFEVLEDTGMDDPFIACSIHRFLEFVIVCECFVQSLNQFLVVKFGPFQLLSSI